ncbi:uncharacterized protein AB9X84_002768 isoform 2-T2 [Acanthopagrus schlegelii]
MDSFRWIQMFLSLILLLHVTGTVQTKPFAVTPGVQVNLPCEKVTDTEDKCKRTTWIYTHSGTSITLFEEGKIHKDASVKSDRLTLDPDCSLVIKTVTAEDDGRYSCRHFKSGEGHGEDTHYDLTVVTAATRQSVSSFTVRVKDDVILPCNNVIDGQNNCDSTTWLFTGSRSRSVVELVEYGQIGEDVKAKDRLSVTEKCSLVIKKVTVEDAGRYICQQYEYRGGPKSSSDSVVYLSVVSMTEHQNHDEVTLNCSVLTYEPCRHTVKWLYEGKEVVKVKQEVKISQSLCSASVRALSFSYVYKSEFKSVQCSVTDGDKEQQLFPFRLQSSGEKPGEETTTTISDGASSELTARTDCSVVDYIMLVLRVAELVLITVITVLLIRAPGNQRPVRRSGAAASQVDHDEDEDDGVMKYENCGDTSASVRLR